MFVDHFEWDIPEEHRFEALDLSLRDTSARWWGKYKDNFSNSKEYRKMMQLIFGYTNTRLSKTYT